MVSEVSLPTDVEWQRVESSNIDFLAHDRKMMQLWVAFKGGAVYRYDGVARQIYLDLLDAESVGKMFNEVIKSNKTQYPFRKMTD